MTNHPDSDNTWEHDCRQAVRHLMAQFQWALVLEEDLTAAVLRQMSPNTSANALRRLIIHTYAVLLYEACRQSSDHERRERGFTDLFQFLYRFAIKRMPDQAEDLVNQTLLVIYEQIEECREPGAFLSFAWWKLRAVLKKMQQQEHATLRLVETADQFLPAASDQERALEVHVMRAEQLRLVLDTIYHLLSEREQHVLLLTFFGSYSDRDISQQLNLTTANVRVIRHRALEKVRQHLHIRMPGEQNDKPDT